MSGGGEFHVSQLNQIMGKAASGGFVSGGNPMKSRPNQNTGSPMDINQQMSALFSMQQFPNAPNNTGRGSPSQVRRPSAQKERGNSPGGAGTPTTMPDEWNGGGGRRASRQQPRASAGGSSSRTTPTRNQQQQNGRYSTGTQQSSAADQAAAERVKEQLFEGCLEAALKNSVPEGMLNAATFDPSTTSIQQVMTHIETAFWSYIDVYSTAAQLPVAMPRFERGLLKDFTVEVLRRAQHLCALWPEAPKGGVDCDKDEVNKKKVAEYFHRLFCEHKMSLPAAGLVLLSQDGKKLFMVRKKLCGDGYTLPKEKQRPNEAPIATAGRILTDLTADPSVTAALANARPISFTLDRFSTKQPQTLFLVPGVPETSMLQDGERSWEPLANMPYLDGVVSGRPSTLGSKSAGKYETAALLLQKLAQSIGDVLADIRAGRHLDGPPRRVTEAPPRILNYTEIRDRLAAKEVYSSRWSNIDAARATTLPNTPEVMRRRETVKLNLMKQLVNVSS